MNIRCYYCGGTTAPELVSDLYAEGGIYVAVEQVPADVCQQCRERYFAANVVERLLDITDQARRTAPEGARAHVVVVDYQDSLAATAG